MPMTGEVVLVVDDNEIRRNELVQYLEGAGVVAQEAASCVEALALLERIPVPLIFAEAELDDKSGYYLLRRVKETYPACEVVLLAQNATSYNLLQALRLGAFDFIVRPLDTGEILRPTLDRAARMLALSRSNARTVVELEKKTRSLERALELLRALNYSMERLTALTGTEELLRGLLDAALTTLGARCGFIALVERSSGRIGVRVAQGYAATPPPFCGAEGLVAALLRRKKTLLLGGSLPEELARRAAGEELLFPHAGILAVPLLLRGREAGLVALCGQADSHTFTPDDLAFLEQLSHHTALVLEHVGSMLRLQRQDR